MAKSFAQHPMFAHIPEDWRWTIEQHVDAAHLVALGEFVDAERREYSVYPAETEVFAALKCTPFDRVKVVLLGQDPYHGPGEAHGLSFSVRPKTKTPPSLRNIFKELHQAQGVPIPNHGYLEAWAERGVLLLNTVLTVREHKAASHRGKGWEQVTDALLRALNQRERGIVFLLLGRDAHKKAESINTSTHLVVTAAHPSPLSAHRGFFGSNAFGRVNDALRTLGHKPIDWSLDDL